MTFTYVCDRDIQFRSSNFTFSSHARKMHHVRETRRSGYCALLAYGIESGRHIVRDASCSRVTSHILKPEIPCRNISDFFNESEAKARMSLTEMKMRPVDSIRIIQN